MSRKLWPCIETDLRDLPLIYWNIYIHCKKQEGAESTQQLAEDRMAITRVFMATHYGKQAAEGRRRRKRKREEDAKGEAQQGKKKVCNLPRTRRIRFYPRKKEV